MVSWSRVGRKQYMPITPSPVNSAPAIDARNKGRRRSDGSIIGAVLRRSIRANTTASNTVAAASEATGARNQPPRPRVSALSKVASAEPSAKAPGRSGRPPRGLLDSWRTRAAAATTSRPAAAKTR